MVSDEQGVNTKLVLDNPATVDYQNGMSDVDRKSKQDQIPNYISAHRLAAGMPDHELARLAKTSQPQINRLENGKRRLTVEWLMTIGEALGKSLEEMLKPPAAVSKNVDGDPQKGLSPKVAMSDSERISLPPNAGPTNEPVKNTRRRIDVLGRAAGGREGKIILNGDRIGQIFAPPSVEAATNPYALYVFGTSMEPRYEDGEMVIANPDLPYRKGHYVVVQLITDEEGVFDCYVKRFVSFGKELVLEQLNPPKGHDATMRFPAERVHSIHKLVGPDGK